MTRPVSASSTDEALAQYRAYVIAAREGKSDDVLKLIEPVPESCKTFLAARIKMEIAVEALKKEMIAQMGPAKTADDVWTIGGIPYDDVLKGVKAVAQDENTMAILGNVPGPGTQMVCGAMVRQQGKWLVPAWVALDLEPTDKFVEPDA